MSEPRGVSISEISCFLECRRRWYVTYWRKLDPIRHSFTGAAQLGSRVHLGLQEHFQGGDAFQALTWLRDSELEQVLRADMVSSEEEIVKEHNFAVLIVQGYLEWLEDTGLDSDFDVRGVESRIQCPSPFPDRYYLKGKADLLLTEKSTGFIGLRDFKTVGSLTAGLSVLDLNPQARMYALIEQINAHTDLPQFVQWEMLLKSKRTARAKPPFYARHQIRFNPPTLWRFWDRVGGILRDMAIVEEQLDSGVDPMICCYPHPSPDCSWKCPHLSICGMFDDPRSDVEYVLSNLYELHDPYARYAESVPANAPTTE